MKIMRLLQCLIRKYQESMKIDKHMYHDMYMEVKGNIFKNNCVLIESIHKSKAKKAREKPTQENHIVGVGGGWVGNQ
ncbi:60S ribosomal protein l19-2 [Phtheirospermum japonicum]|uniref:60S ribosomal protein l19-2 n=1 Tax=Phtheirospermum japonicum TaxID=374723 RepID=A0A830C6L8_9LAMI|nr:60S ribosomal protein l19-2 [Phtheirospermum japonicum]